MNDNPNLTLRVGKFYCYVWYIYKEKIAFPRLNEALYSAMTSNGFSLNNLDYFHTNSSKITISMETKVKLVLKKVDALPKGSTYKQIFLDILAKSHPGIKLPNYANQLKVKL